METKVTYQMGSRTLVAESLQKLFEGDTIENWIKENQYFSSIIIGKQIKFSSKKTIDFLALDQSGDTIAIKLKKEKELIETITQTLNYISWIKSLEISNIKEIFQKYRRENGKSDKNLDELYKEVFPDDTPKNWNKSYRLLIISDTLDLPSKRELKRLSKEISINVAFLNEFKHNNEQSFLTLDFFPKWPEQEIHK